MHRIETNRLKQAEEFSVVNSERNSKWTALVLKQMDKLT